MSVEFAILLWIIVLVIVFFILKTYRITWWSSLVFAMLVSWIILCLAYPFSTCPKFNRNNHSNKYSSECRDDDFDRHDKHRESEHNITNDDELFLLISLVTILIVIVYLIQRVFRDREDYTSHQQNTMSPYQY